MLNVLSLVVALATAQPAATAAPLDAIPQTRLDASLRCLLGVYTLPKGEKVIITGTDGQPRGLQYTLGNGQFGNLREDSSGSFSSEALTIDFAPCSVGTMKLSKDKSTVDGVRIRLIEKTTSITSEGIRLHGKLVLPANGRAESAAVWIEGSNNNPSTDDAVWQYELASRGVATFVYDKRGTGASAGTPSSDFHIRANDSAAAVKEVRRLAPGIKRVGVIGGSQGGWVAPLTATKVHLDFVIAAFAMAEGPIAQDQDLVEQQLLQAGFDKTTPAQTQARELTKITEKIVRSNMREGLTELDAFKLKYAGASWLAVILPRSYTGIFLKFSSEDIKTLGPAMAQGLTFEFDPKPIITEIKPRQLWLLGGNDQQAPNAKTQVILRQLQQQRADIAVVVFPNADHGLVERTADGLSTIYSTRQFDVAADWIKNGKLPASGSFIVMPKTN